MIYALDSLLNKLTMYRLVLYYLIFLMVAALALGLANLLPFSPINLVSNTFFLIIACYLSNKIYARVFGAVTNIESVFVTALILAFLITPAPLLSNIGFLTAASIFASGSKYLLAIKRKHIFNPVAASVVLTGLLFNQFASWWIGVFPLSLLTFLGGILVLRRIQRFSLVAVFLAVYLFVLALSGLLHGNGLSYLLQTWSLTLLHSSLLFFALVMVTEPLTSPVIKKWEIVYAALVATLSALPQLPLINLSLTPEQALIVGNVFAYIVNPKFRLVLKLREKRKLTPSIYEFTFDHPRGFTYKSGQFFEWTLPHPNTDSRGNRRFFSLSSSPSEGIVAIIVKIFEKSSSFKMALRDLPEGKEIVASNLGGEFTLPEDKSRKLVFIAGGIGIAPYRSMIKYLIDAQEKRKITLIYSNNTESEILFKDTLKQAEKFGVETVFTLTDEKNLPKSWKGEKGRIDEGLVRKYVPDFKECLFYLSGPQLMVENFQKILADLGLTRGNIRLDYFPGYNET